MSRRRLKLWVEDPHCRKCGTLTVLPENAKCSKKPDENQATIQHLDSRLSDVRGTYGETETPRTTLFCWKCNNEENRETQAQVPICILRERARDGHINKKAGHINKQEKYSVRSKDSDSNS